MKREEIARTIENSIKTKSDKTITIDGNFGCGYEKFEIRFNHIHKVAICKEYMPICVLSDLAKFGYINYKED